MLTRRAARQSGRRAVGLHDEEAVGGSADASDVVFEDHPAAGRVADQVGTVNEPHGVVAAAAPQLAKLRQRGSLRGQDLLGQVPGHADASGEDLCGEREVGEQLLEDACRWASPSWTIDRYSVSSMTTGTGKIRVSSSSGRSRSRSAMSASGRRGSQSARRASAA